MIDRGRGTPLVLVPGIQGRWEWMAPAVDALAERGRVLAFSLCDEPTSGFGWRPEAGFRNFLDQVDAALDRAGVEQGVLVGVSFGGLIAAEYAARRPARVQGLVLASALPLDWAPDARARFYLRAPRLLSPLFCVGAPTRAYPEIAAAFPQFTARARFSLTHGRRVIRAFLSPSRMARRLRWMIEHRFAEASAITAPVLIVTGEPHLDRVVPTHVTARCAAGLRNVRHAVLPRTGHLGVVTRPEEFADLVMGFSDESRDGAFAGRPAEDASVC
jgi:pimeloyl-ACP methyl ester carboxylesterase